MEWSTRPSTWTTIGHSAEVHCAIISSLSRDENAPCHSANSHKLEVPEEHHVDIDMYSFSSSSLGTK